MIRWLVARWVRSWRGACRRQARAWARDPENGGRSNLWWMRAEGASAMLDWMGVDAR